jgi:hypothetical protein
MRANEAVVERIARVRPFLVDLAPGAGVVPGWDADVLLHAGPPLRPGAHRCAALQGGLAGALMLDRPDLGVDEALSRAGSMTLRPAHDCNGVATFGGVMAPSTPVFHVVDRSVGMRSFAAINEGRGAALRYGSTDPATLTRARWLHGEFQQVLGAAIRKSGGIDLFGILEQALQMGDEGHSRHKASSALFLAEVAPWVCEVAANPDQAARVLKFVAGNDFFFLPLAMAAAKSALSAAHGVAGASIVTAIAFNGVDCGIRVSGLADWVTAPVPSVEGRYFKGYAAPDAGPVIGDSEIIEALGLGALALGAAPVLAQYLQGDPSYGSRLTDEMYRITVAEHAVFRIPHPGMRGAPLGIDVRKVVDTGITPAFNTGIAHVRAGVGQIGAGHGRVPLACFEQAAAQLAALDANRT